MKKEKTIYDLKLHESLWIKDNELNNIYIIRVHGGFIYKFYYHLANKAISLSTTFVPCSIYG